MVQLAFKLLEIDREATRKRVEEALISARTYQYSEKMKDAIQPITEAIDRLGRLERELIKKRYMEDDEIYDFEVVGMLNLSERKYYRVKSRAFYKLAFWLELEVVVDPEGTTVES